VGHCLEHGVRRRRLVALPPPDLNHDLDLTTSAPYRSANPARRDLPAARSDAAPRQRLLVV
jgi:hypothetical protein